MNNAKRSEAGNDGWLELKFISNPLDSQGGKQGEWERVRTERRETEHTPLGWGGYYRQYEQRKEKKGENWGGNQAWDFLRNPIDR